MGACSDIQKSNNDVGIPKLYDLILIITIEALVNL